jgi:Membrane bound FAD containing D-sorbitol dehydrogenase
MNTYRRDFLKKLGLSLFVLMGQSSSALSFSDLFYTGIEKQSPSTKTTFDVFYKLCQWLTQREKLDKNVAHKMYDIFLEEPWGQEHILKLYNKIEPIITFEKNQFDLSGLIKNNTLDDVEIWFSSHILVTWYLGVYYHEKRPSHRITYEHALMYQSVTNLTPIPYLEFTPYGTWATLPEGIK